MLPMLDVPHNLPFDPTHGYDLESLLKVEGPNNEPQDFDAFWQELYAQALAIDPAVEVAESGFQSLHHRIDKVFFSVLGGYRVGAYLCHPKSGDVNRLVVHGHGYGGRTEPIRGMGPQTAVICPVAPGFHISAQEDLPLNNAQEHVVQGIGHRDTYVFRQCAATLWSAASVLLEFYPDQAESLIYVGGSFGGGMGALMLPWDGRYRGAQLSVVSFCHHPIRLTCPCTGSGLAVTERFRRDPGILHNTLRYFDAAFSVKRLTIPTHFASALFDPAVPPPGQFCAHNDCAAEKLLTVRKVGHFKASLEDLKVEARQQRSQVKELGLVF